jgi:hypothetical protein
MPDRSADLARAVVKSFRGRPKAVWVEPWGWSLALGQESGSAFLVPDPERPVLATRLPASFLDQESFAEMPRPAREAVLAASIVGEAVWVEWALGSAEVVDSVLPLIREG